MQATPSGAITVARATSSPIPSFRQALRRTWRIAVVSRLMVLAIGCLALVTFGPDRRALPPPTSDNVILDLPSRWDVGWYVGLASRGYRWDGQADRFETLAFFPAWPALLYASTRLVPHTSVAWAWTGVGVATLLFVVALAYLHRLCAAEHGGDAADSATLFLACFPFGIYFGIPYTESLFLLTTVAAFYHARWGSLTVTAAWGLVAGLTRPNGCLLAVALTAILWPTLSARSTAWRSRLAVLGAASGPVAGMLMYSAYVWRLTGQPFLWSEVQTTWGRDYQALSHLLWSPVSVIVERGPYYLLVERPYDVMHMLAFAGALAAVWPVTRRIGLAGGLFMLVNLFPPLLVGGWPSMGRYVSVLFPLFLWLGVRFPGPHGTLLVLAFAMGQALIAALFFTFRAVY